ncbi:phage tail protein [Ensifer sp. ENS10]|uniref:phage tail protein n=1 Tax=Ensifer sp. ENS10 TaxID=2769286 RepID=UPI00178611C0|nr:tail fiber protein [Ensifer sp. ENS10]MBD9512038.1 phage tail protein [Ensifer sp. ENS10]
MTEVFLGQIMMTGFDFAPRGFALANGQLLPIAQNSALFSLLGTFYGGNGTTNFCLPNMQGRIPVAFGPSYDPSWNPTPMEIGQFSGSETVTLTTPQLPQHIHQGLGTSSTGVSRNPAGNLVGTTSTAIYGAATGPQVTLASDAVAPAGGGQPHDNMQPFCVINFCVALAGSYPSRN